MKVVVAIFILHIAIINALPSLNAASIKAVKTPGTAPEGLRQIHGEKAVKLKKIKKILKECEINKFSTPECGKIVSQFDEDGDGDIGNLERKRAINGFIYAINSPKPKKGPHGTKVKERSKPMHTLEDEVFAATKKVNRDRSTSMVGDQFKKTIKQKIEKMIQCSTQETAREKCKRYDINKDGKVEPHEISSKVRKLTKKLSDATGPTRRSKSKNRTLGGTKKVEK